MDQSLSTSLIIPISSFQVFKQHPDRQFSAVSSSPADARYKKYISRLSNRDASRDVWSRPLGAGSFALEMSPKINPELTYARQICTCIRWILVTPWNLLHVFMPHTQSFVSDAGLKSISVASCQTCTILVQSADTWYETSLSLSLSRHPSIHESARVAQSELLTN